MKNKETFMTFLFKCPPPCNREITVEAKNNMDAIDKMIMAGAMGCRSNQNHCSCKKAPLDMPPIPAEKLRHIVAMCIQA